MSIFDYPRINVYGTIRLNPGTANNDDYAASATLPASWGPFAGEALGLIDSKQVKARTYGQSDADFLQWAQKAQPFDTANGTQEIIPAEWNFYGDMSSQNVTTNGQSSIRVVGVQVGDSGVDLDGCIGADLDYSGSITDINPEGSPPATQFFFDQIALGPSGSPLIQAELSKGTGQWINFYRNVNIVADGGAGSYVYHALRGAKVNIPGWEKLGAVGVVFRYYLYRAQLVNPDGATNAGIEKLYESEETNPKDLEIVGTFTPLYADETITAAPTGRLLTHDVPNITTPTSHNNGGGKVALGPGVLHRQGDRLTADLSGTFPDNYDPKSGANPKFDFGPAQLVAVNGTEQATVGPVPYQDTDAGNAAGWLFDFDLSNSDAKQLVDKAGTTFKLVSENFGDVLEEADYYFVSNQQAVYAQQHGPGDSFYNEGSNEPATIAVFHRGEELTAENCPPITVWEYRSVPLQSPGDAVAISTSFLPGQKLQVDTDKPGNRLLTFTIGDAARPPKSYSTFMNPPWVTNAPQISIRILPNEDYDRYFVDPSSDKPVGNGQLTFDIVYEHVLQVYYLLYPTMNFLPLNSPVAVGRHAKVIIERTDPKLWMSTGYMPRTRDLSDSRRRLLQAWCRKVLQEQASSS